MRLLTFPGTYEDDRGVEPLEWRVSPTWPVGWPPGYAISTVIRGVRVRGCDFDTLLPRPRGAGDGLLHWDRLGLVECVLRGDLPLTVASGGVARPAPLRFELDLRRSSRDDPRAPILRLTCLLDDVHVSVTDDWFEDALAGLDAALPEEHRIMACLACAWADYSPTGHGLTGMRCHRDAGATGVRPTTGVTEEVLETYLCGSFRRRSPAA